MRPKHFSLLVLLLALIATPALAGEWPHAREGWTIGLNLGGGSAEAKFDSDAEVVSTDRTGGGAGNFRVGYAVRPDLVIGLESSAWVRTETAEIVSDEVDVTTTVSVVGLGLTWYPQQGGFFARGVIGAGQFSQEFDLGSLNVEVSEAGFGLGLALGYEWRVTRTFAIGPQLDFAYVNLGEIDVVDEAGNDAVADVTINYTNLTLLANWYF